MISKPISELNDFIESNKNIETFFKDYANIDKETLLNKAYDIYAKAMDVHQYRCIASFRFLTPRIINNPFYNQIKDIWQGKLIADIGCNMGTDLRRMNFDGANQENLYGLELENRFIELGYDLFNDRASNKMTFLTGNILDIAVIDQLNLQNKFDIIYSSAVIHLLNKDDIKKLIQNIYNFLKPNGIFFGQTSGLSEPHEIEDSTGKSRYLHSKESLEAEFINQGFKKVEIEVREHESHGNYSNHGTQTDVRRKRLYFYCKK